MTDDDNNEPLELTEADTFAAFEAKTKEGIRDEPPPAKPENDDAPEPANDDGDDPEAAEHDDDDKRRSKPVGKRIAEITWQKNEAIRRAEAAEARIAALEGAAPKVEPAKALEELQAKKPKADDFEFGEADSAYIDALTDWKLDVRDAQREAKDAEGRQKSEATAEQQQIVGKLHEGMASVEKAGKEKYDDFEAVITAAAEARGEPLPPLVGIGISVSPAGADIAYRLATDEAACAKIERLARTDMMGAALAFGELEGEYLSDDDSDLDLRDQVDQMRLNGRMKARLKSGGKPRAQGKIATDAPEPAKHGVRGGGGRFAAGADTKDFAAFEAQEKAKAATR